MNVLRELHPSWCQRHHPDVVMHCSQTDVVRDRDGIQLDVYLVSYGGQPLVSLDMAADDTLIELDMAEASQLYQSLGRLLEHAGQREPAAA
jgi:hypothetical protein